MTKMSATSQAVIFAWDTGMDVLTRLWRNDLWNVGIVDAPIEAFLTPGARPPVHWLREHGRSRYVADPFTLDDVILVEDFDYRDGRGHIAVIHTRPDGTFTAPASVIAMPVHLSFPYLLRYQGDVYCIPESALAGTVYLFRAEQFPFYWKQCATLIESFAAADTTIFIHEGRWWLLCTEAHGVHNSMSLHAWHAPDLFGPWSPHAGNPIKRDVRSSRPAGTPFVHDGQLYRPAQDCSRTYGGAVVINHVLRLTPTEFAEVPVVTVLPYADSPYPDGLHTLNAYGRQTLIDGKRRGFIWHGSRHVVRQVARKIITVGLRRVTEPAKEHAVNPVAVHEPDNGHG